jgi:hypothetical protein
LPQPYAEENIKPTKTGRTKTATTTIRTPDFSQTPPAQASTPHVTIANPNKIVFRLITRAHYKHEPEPFASAKLVLGNHFDIAQNLQKIH